MPGDAFPVVGILLAAGRGRRFDPAGLRNKLLQPAGDGDSVAAASARHLLAAVPRVVAVVRPDDAVTTAPLAAQLAAQLTALGCEVTACAEADNGMAASLVHGLRHAVDGGATPAGFIMALGDMPRVLPATIEALVQALARGADIAVPVHQGRRGNPVAFGRRHLPQLLALTGDQGARGIVRNEPVNEVTVDDPGILLDVDTPSDLQ